MKAKTIRVTLQPFNQWNRDNSEMIEGFKITKLVNAVAVEVDGKKFPLGYQLTTAQAEKLNGQEGVEVTVISN